MKRFILLPVNLRHFDGEGAGAAPAEGQTGPGEQGERLLSEAAARNRANTKPDPYENVVFGKAPEGNGEQDAAAATADNSATSNTLEEKRKAYDELINGEYKEFYTRDTQNLINRRFKETKNLEKQVADSQPVIDMLMQRYGVQDTKALQDALESDSAYWQEAADEAGMSVSQYMEFQKLQRENRALLQAQEDAVNQEKANQQLAQWTMEAQQLKQSYPQFDLEVEAQNPDFVRLLQSGTPMEHAYKVIHLNEILSNERTTTAAFTEKQVMDNVRARGSRPSEAGLNSNNGITYKSDVSKFSKQDVLEIAKRAKRGEKISF